MLESGILTEVKRIFFCEQKLIPKRHANLRTLLNSDRPFAFLKIEKANGARGYSTLSPLPSIGSLSLGEMKDLLQARRGNYPEMLSKALYYAFNFDQLWMTLEAELPRFQQVKNNFLVLSLEDLNDEVLNRIREQGFESIKIKLRGASLDLFFARAESLAKSGLQVRLDFNESLTPQQYFGFLKSLEEVQGSLLALQGFFLRIDYIEDPCRFADIQQFPMDQDLLMELPIFLDQGLNETLIKSLHPAVKGLIVKPSWNFIEPRLEMARAFNLELRFTSAMDHDLGIIQAISELLRFKKIEGAHRSRVSHDGDFTKENQGFLTSDCFEPTATSLLNSRTSNGGPFLKFEKGDRSLQQMRNELCAHLETLNWVEL